MMASAATAATTNRLPNGGDPGTPNNPGNPDNNCDSPTCPPGTPGNPGPGGLSFEVRYKECSDKLLSLPHVTGRDVEAIGEQERIHIAPICDIDSSTLESARLQDVGLGNSAGLLAAIESNGLLMEQLQRHGYHSRDVIGILMGSNAVVLYVHKA